MTSQRCGLRCQRTGSKVHRGGHPVGFIVSVNALGVTVLCRKVATRDRDPYCSPLSDRYDELDGQMWLDNVSIPWPFRSGRPTHRQRGGVSFFGG
jgi:hypothetical protein